MKSDKSALDVLEYLPPGKNVPVTEVPSSHRLIAAYAAGYVAYVSEPGARGRRVALTPVGRAALAARKLKAASGTRENLDARRSNSRKPQGGA